MLFILCFINRVTRSELAIKIRLSQYFNRLTSHKISYFKGWPLSGTRGVFPWPAIRWMLTGGKSRWPENICAREKDAQCSLSRSTSGPFGSNSLITLTVA